LLPLIRIQKKAFGRPFRGLLKAFGITRIQTTVVPSRAQAEPTF